MNIVFDPEKNARNIRERGLSFERAADFDFSTALFWTDRRRDYGEVRIIGLGYVEARLHVLVFRRVDADCIRVISFRKANRREVRRYEQEA